MTKHLRILRTLSLHGNLNLIVCRRHHHRRHRKMTHLLSIPIPMRIFDFPDKKLSILLALFILRDKKTAKQRANS